MSAERVPLEIADPRAAIRYLGEMQSRAMDPIHEPIQNLLDEGATRIDVELDRGKRCLRIRGNARPIPSVVEARRILQSICASTKKGKLGEKGVGLLSFVSVGKSMRTLSQGRGGGVVWFTLNADDLASGRVGSEEGRRLPHAGTEVLIKGVSARTLKFRFGEDRVIKDIKRRWGTFIANGLRICVNGKDVSSFVPPLVGDAFTKQVRVGPGKARIGVDLVILKEPSEVAAVSITHGGQANFLISDVPLFDGHNAFTQGMVNGTITGDVAPINASRTGFKEGEAFEAWVESILELEEELGRIIEDKIRTAAETRDATMLDDWMEHLKRIFADAELPPAARAAANGARNGAAESNGAEAAELNGDAEANGKKPVNSAPKTGKGGLGRLPTVPYAGFTKAPPNVRVVRERKTFRINVNYPDFILASKYKGGRRKYIRELCMHEAYVYSLAETQRDWYCDRADEFLGFWTKAFIGRDGQG